MKILAIETTDKTGSLAAGENGSLLGFRSLPTDQRSAQSLVPTISDFLVELGWTVRDLECIAVGIGPGSFTGLRVGVATAKILAWSLSTQIIGVNTLEAMAVRIPVESEDRILSCAVDAQRGDVAFQRFRLKKIKATIVPESLDDVFKVCSAKKWLGIDNQNSVPIKDDGVKNTENAPFIQTELPYRKEGILLQQDTIFCGPILQKLQDRVPVNLQTCFAKEEYWFPSAQGILQIAWNRIALDRWDDMWTLLPVYSRLSAAEERLINKIHIHQN